MFERFTDQARRAVVLAQEIARELNSPAMDPEHLLIALATEEKGVAGIVLRKHTTAEALQGEVIALGGKFNGKRNEKNLPFDPTLKKVIQESLRHALKLGHNYIGTEHLFLSFLANSSEEEVSGKVLAQLGLNRDALTAEMIKAVDVGGDLEPGKSAAGMQATRVSAIQPRVPKRASSKKRREKSLSLEELDIELSRISSAKDVAIDEENWDQVRELRLIERELLVEWAKLIREGKHRVPEPSIGIKDGRKVPAEPGRLPDRQTSNVILMGSSRYHDSSFSRHCSC